jgi:hypothetical protein
MAHFVNPAVRRRVLHGLRNEGQLADALGAHNLPDSEPADVVHMEDAAGRKVTDPVTIKHFLRHREMAVNILRDRNASPQMREQAARVLSLPCRFFEVKSLVVQQGAGRVSMSTKARRRKENWERRYGAKFYTVAFDDRRGAKYSGNRLYFREGVGSAALSDFEPAADFGELRAKLGV